MDKQFKTSKSFHSPRFSTIRGKMKVHKWTPEEESAWATCAIPEEMVGNSADDLIYNMRKLKEYVTAYGYYIEHGLLDVIVKESNLRQELRLAKPVQHNLGDAFVDAIKNRPQEAPEPT